MEVDRAGRNDLIEAMNRFLQEKTTAFDFDDEIQAIAQKSSDPTVDLIALRLWFYYDDFVDHPVVLSREDWNYFQRLILLLQSDARMERIHSRRWTWSQIPAVVSLALFAATVVSFGFDRALIAFLPFFGLASYLISTLNKHHMPVSPDRLDLDLACYRNPDPTVMKVFGF